MSIFWQIITVLADQVPMVSNAILLEFRKESRILFISNEEEVIVAISWFQGVAFSL